MKRLLLSVAALTALVLPCVAASVCLRLLKNDRETRALLRKSGYIWRWNASTAEFENLEALTLDNSAFCSVDAVDDLRGRTLVVVTDVSIYPYVIVNATTNEITGFMGDVWKTLEETLKFKTIYKKMKWRSIWMLPKIDVDELLIATSMYTHTSSYITYSVPFATIWYSLFIQPDGAAITTWWYIKIFSNGVWATCFVFVVCATCSITGVQRVKRLARVNRQECDCELASPFFNLLYVLGGMTGQGLQIVPRDLSMRVIMLSLMTGGMLLSYGFSSALVSCLASKGNSVALTDLEDVAAKRTHSLCVRNNSGAYRYFTVDNTVDSDLRDKWRGLVNEDCPDMLDKETLLARMCQPGFVYLEVPGVFLPAYRRVERTCEYLQLRKTYWESKLSFLHARAAAHRRLVDAYLMRMRSAGILAYLEKKWLRQQFNIPAQYVQSDTFQPVELEHVRLAVCSLVAMALVSALICALENVWYGLRENSRPGGSCHWAAPPRRHLARSRRLGEWRGKSKSSMLLLLDASNARGLSRGNFSARISRWQTSRKLLNRQSVSGSSLCVFAKFSPHRRASPAQLPEKLSLSLITWFKAIGRSRAQ